MNKVEDNRLLRGLPSVDEVMGASAVAALAPLVSREVLISSAREAVAALRSSIIAGCSDVPSDPEALPERVVADVQARVYAYLKPSLRPVVNATGVVVHTNLGRSLLAQEAVDAMMDVAGRFSTLEYDPATLSRGSRHDHLEPLICALTGAQAAVVVNNNAAAVILVLAEFAKGRGAVVSRGELVEIGGSFRIPDIMNMSGALMREVGTTNKTRVLDYASAVDDNTAMLLKVHPSNYRMLGFTESVSVAQLCQLAEEVNASRRADGDGVRACSDDVLVYEDQGSGALLRLDCFGDYHEPTVQESVLAGCDLVSFSGDKLLGGAQAGIVIGRRELIDRLKKNPLMRALRPDKMTLAALEATLRLYLNPAEVAKKVPTIRMLTEPVEIVKQRAEELKRVIAERIDDSCVEISVVNEVARSGGGALPACDIASAAVRVAFKRGCAQDCERFMVNRNTVPVIARIRHEAILLDARTVQPDELGTVAEALAAYFTNLQRDKGREGSCD